MTLYAKFEEGLFDYNINEDKTCTITNLFDCPLDKEIVFPKQINKKINEKIETYNVKNIDINALSGKLKNYITKLSFEDNIEITNLTINLSELKTLDLSKLNTLKNISILGCNSLENLIIPNIEILPSNFIIGNVSLKNFIIPNSVKTIETNSISIYNLDSIIIPDSVISIKNNAFKGCNNLKSIIIKNPTEINLGESNSNISNNNTIIYVNEDLLENYTNKYPNMSFEKIQK